MCWGPNIKQGSPVHGGKEGPWALIRESLVCEVKKGHEGPTSEGSQRKVKEKAKGREPKLGPWMGHPSLRSGPFVGKFENAEKDIGDPKDSLGMSHMYP